MGKESFILYDCYATQINLLNDEQAGVLFKAIFAHRTGNELPKMDGATAMAFSFIQRQIEDDAERYESICEKRRQAGALGAEYGRLGGRPKKPQETPKGDTETPNGGQKTPDNEYDNEYEYDKSQKKEEIKKKKGNAQAQFFNEFPFVLFDNYDRNVLAELSESDWQFIIEQFKGSEWLRTNVKTVSMLCRLSTRILAGQYAPYKRTQTDGITDEEREENVRRFEAMFGKDAGY